MKKLEGKRKHLKRNPKEPKDGESGSHREQDKNRKRPGKNEELKGNSRRGFEEDSIEQNQDEPPPPGAGGGPPGR